MARKRPRKAKKVLNIAIYLILGALGGCLGPILKGLGGVLEALGGVLEACGSVLEALGGVLEALEGALKTSWRLLKPSWRPRWVKITLESEAIEKQWEKQGFWGSCRGCLGRLGGSWGRLGGVLEALGGVLKAKMSQDSVKMGPRTRQERNPRELPSGLSLPSRWAWILRPLSWAASGSARPGLSSFLRKNITRRRFSQLF